MAAASIADAGLLRRMSILPAVGLVSQALLHSPGSDIMHPNKALPGPGSTLGRAMDQSPGCLIRRPNVKKILSTFNIGKFALKIPTFQLL